METTLRDVQGRLIDWNQRHAFVVIAATALSLGLSSAWPIVLTAAASFGVLMRDCRPLWRPPGRFGLANAVTSFRLLGILALPQLLAAGPLAVAAWAVVLLVLDGLDGWLARRSGLASEFGEYFDKEADALLVLVLCHLLFDSGRLGPWILVPGLLRYAFVIFLMVARPPAVKEQRSELGKWIFLGSMSAWIVAFTPFPGFYEPYAVVMTVLLLYSFAAAVIGLYRPPAARLRDPGS